MMCVQGYHEGANRFQMDDPQQAEPMLEDGPRKYSEK